ncbi:MAG: LPS export ABC transporter periplasmic protein LptC [Bacteroidetes bacterium]|nr:LPS export ABC transporter periplasmic protein LptC [Bacteroidota bacterium]
MNLCLIILQFEESDSIHCRQKLRAEWRNGWIINCRLLVPSFLLFLLFCFTAASPVHAQDRTVHLVHADSLIGYTIGADSYRELIGHVTLQHVNTVLRCDSALQNLTMDIVDLYGNVEVRDDTLTLLTKRARYSGKTSTVTTNTPVYLNDRKRTLTADSGSYDSQTKVAHFFSNVFVRDSVSHLRAQRLIYYRDDGKTIADMQVRIRSLQNNVTIYGSHFENYEKRDFSLMSGKPLLVQIDTSSDGKIDTLMITSKTMQAFRDTSNQRFVAEDSVLIIRGSLSARCGLGTYFSKDSVVVLQKKPVVWYEDNQLTGDSIDVYIVNKQVSRVNVIGAAFAVSQSDSIYTNRFNQLKGRRLTMFLKDRKVDRIIVESNATSLYYLYDKNKPNGINRVSGDRVVMYFTDGKIDRIAVISGVEGDYYPEKMIADNTGIYNLTGFVYIKNRPERVDFPASWK